MKLLTCFTVIVCRLARWVLRKLGKGGTNVPGTIALKLHPKILGELSKNTKIILITGTNGKTTITRMIEQCLIEAGLKYFTNKSGANMDTGITAEFVVNSTLGGRCKYPYALIECDELAFKNVSRYAEVDYIVISNIFRDQLDRYGEITHTITGLYDGIKNVPNAVVCLNADCSLTTSLKDRLPNKFVFYGLDCPIYKDKVKEVSDAPYCIKCGSEYKYNYITYGHLGSYYCEECGYKKPDTNVSVSQILSSDVDSSTATLNINGFECEVKINLPGGYNVYNAVACASLCYAMGLDESIIKAGLSNFECGFGRMEKFNINGTDIRMILVKNPAGANQVLSFLCNITEPSLFVVGLNDRYADGTDISWIWDADFEKLAEIGDKLHGVIVTGIRADDMAMRFKYAGIPLDKIKVISDYAELVNTVINQSVPVYIMPTYTAMLEIREKISKTYSFKEFWK